MLHYNNDRIQHSDLWIKDNYDQLVSEYEKEAQMHNPKGAFLGYADEYMEYMEIQQYLVWSNLFPEKAKEAKYQGDMPPHSFPISSNPRIDDCW